MNAFAIGLAIPNTRMHWGSDDDGILLAVRRALDAGTLQEEEVRIILHTLLSAGGESTSSLVGNAVRLLADDPELQQRLREKPELIDTFVEEALRLESPFRQLMRSIPHDTALGGVDIPSGSTAVLLFGSANRDPEQFTTPTSSTSHACPHAVISHSGTAFTTAWAPRSPESKPGQC